MVDTSIIGKNNQKKGVSVYASEVLKLSKDLKEDLYLFTLPQASLITNIYGVVVKDGGASSKIEIKIGEGTQTVELAAKGTVSPAAFKPNYVDYGSPVTGKLTAKTDAEIILVIEYIETQLGTGTFTN